MSLGNVVNVSLDSEVILTIEKIVDGRPMADKCDLEGNVLQAGQPEQKIYTDTLTGKKFAIITHDEKEELLADGEPVYQGIGMLHGWFVPAPDFTINGFHGETTPEGGSKHTIEAPKLEGGHYVRPAAARAKAVAKKKASKAKKAA